jgi:hypothetical protein
MSDFSSDEKTAQLRKGLNADWVVYGVVSKLGKSIVITATLISLNNNETMGGVPIQMDSIEDAFEKMDAPITAMIQRLTSGSSGQVIKGGVSGSGIGIKVTTGIAGTLYFQGNEVATLWDNDSYLIPIDKPNTYNVKMRFGNGKESIRNIVVTGRGVIDVQFGMPSAAPKNLHTGTAKSNSVPLSWDSADSGTSYRVYYNTTNNPAQAKPYGGTVTGTSVTVGGLTPETVYYFWVSALEDGLESEKSPVVSHRMAAYSKTVHIISDNSDAAPLKVKVSKIMEQQEFLLVDNNANYVTRIDVKIDDTFVSNNYFVRLTVKISVEQEKTSRIIMQFTKSVREDRKSVV